MAMRYADRIFMSVNGQDIVDLQSLTVKRNPNRKATPSMTRNRRNRGFTEGNHDFDITAVIAVENLLSYPKFDAIDYEGNDVQITALFGADQLVYHGVFAKDNDVTGSAPGEEVKYTQNFGALDISDPIGNSALLTIALV